MTFAEFLEQREPGRERTGPVPGVAADRNIEGPTIDGDAVHPGSQDDRDRLAVRSMLRGLFKAVNPARPVSPLNSRLLALPFRKRFLSQVMGR